MTLPIFEFFVFRFLLLKKKKSIIPFFQKTYRWLLLHFVFQVFNSSKTHEIINYFSPMDQCHNKHFNWSFIGNLGTCPKFIITMMLLLLVIVHLSYFRRKSFSSRRWENNRGLASFTALFLCCCSGPWRMNICCVTNFLYFFTLETEFISAYFCLFIPHKVLSWSISEASKLILSLWSFCLIIATITIDYADR